MLQLVGEFNLLRLIPCNFRLIPTIFRFALLANLYVLLSGKYMEANIFLTFYDLILWI